MTFQVFHDLYKPFQDNYSLQAKTTLVITETKSWYIFSSMFIEPEVNNCFSLIFRGEYQEIQKKKTTKERIQQHESWFAYS